MTTRRWLGAPALRLAAAPLLACVAAATLILMARAERTAATRELATARGAQARAHEARVRAARELAEVAAQTALYRRLSKLGILGLERRLEWTEALTRIRQRHALAEMRYEIAPRRLLRTLAEGPAGATLHASTLRLDLVLRHENDLLRVLDDLRRTGNAYVAVRRCAVKRAGTSAPDDSAALVRAGCDIDLITIVDRGARA